MKKNTIGFILFLLCLLSQCQTIDENNNTQLKNLNDLEAKQKGAHIFGRIDSMNLQPFVQNNLEWITLVPYAGQKDFDSPTITYYRGDSLRMRQRDSVWKNEIDLAHSAGFKVFMKPHIWIGQPTEGKWRSDIFPANEDDWELWQKNYREYILYYAKIAQRNKVELFCVGTEFSRLSVEKSDFWKSLIQEVKAVYSGELTYAANWYNEYEKITFWNELDYIGVQAYFPLVENKDPTIKEISKGWQQYLPTMESLAKKYNRKILFTEMGYKSTADSAIKPWEWIEYPPNNTKSFSLETQANCYQAFFNTVWNEKWFAGVHIWQMRSDHQKENEHNNLDFTPQGKPAATIITKGFE